MAGYEATLVDEHNQIVTRGEIGNLLVKGDSICSCYWNKHDKTRDAIRLILPQRGWSGTRP